MVVVACCSSIASAGHASFGCLRYEMEIVATLNCGIGGDFSPFGLAEDGTVAGGVACGFDNDILFPFISSESGYSLLPMPPGFPYGRAWGVNDAGFVAGHMHPDSSGFPARAFLYDGRSVVDLGTLPNAQHSYAYAISDESPPTVVGLASFPISPRAVRWVNGAIEQLILPMGPNSVAADISPNGHIAGWMGVSQAIGPTSGFIWHEGRVTTLPPLPGAYACEARAVNDLGDACGTCRFTVRGSEIPLRRAVLWKDGVPINLGVLPGEYHSDATDLATDGTVIGFCTSLGGSVGGAFVWRNGEMAEMTQFIDGPEGFGFGRGDAINDAGQITTVGGMSGEDTLYAIRLTPVPPLLGDLTCDWSVDGADLAILLGAWGPVGTDANPSADLDADGDVDGADLAMLLGAWTGS